MLSKVLEQLIKSDPSLLKPDGSINQTAAARAFGINQPTLHRILSGDSQEPRDRFVIAIAAYFGVEPAQLRGEKEIDFSRRQAMHHQAPLKADEELLLSLFRSLTPPMKKVAIRVVAALKG